MSYEDTSKQALDAEYLASLLDEYIDILIEKNQLKRPTEDEVQTIKEKVIRTLQIKYPKSGIYLIKK